MGMIPNGLTTNTVATPVATRIQFATLQTQELDIERTVALAAARSQRMHGDQRGQKLRIVSVDEGDRTIHACNGTSRE